MTQGQIWLLTLYSKNVRELISSHVLRKIKEAIERDGDFDMGVMWKTVLWQQFGAAIDMLENAVRACPDGLWSGSPKQAVVFNAQRLAEVDALWSNPSRRPAWLSTGVVGCWYLVYHTLFWLDLYLSGSSEEEFTPPAPFALDEIDSAGWSPGPYTKAELQAYLEHGRNKCRATIEALTEEKARQRLEYPWGEVSFAELLLYNMRHVQHHAAQLNLLLRQTVDAAPGWVARAESEP